MEGALQTAYRNYIYAYLNVKNVLSTYDSKLEALIGGWEVAKTMKPEAKKALGETLGIEIAKGVFFDTTENDYHIDIGDLALNLMMVNSDIIASGIPGIQGTGTSVTIDPRSIVKGAQIPKDKSELWYLGNALYNEHYTRHENTENAGLIDLAVMIKDIVKQFDDIDAQVAEQMEGLAMDLNMAIVAIQPSFAELAAAEAAYRAQLEVGEQIQEQRALWRQQVSNSATEQRYLDMYNRVQRNLALTKYTTSFDTAQRYVWELAKVYDYETGLLSSEPQAGKKFLSEIIATRSLGQPGVSINSATTDGGLYDIVNRMKANWDVLKPRLGINNPDKPAKWFSLRRELFRIKPGEEGDMAWRKELAKYRVDNIFENSDFIRHCQPPASANSLVTRNPATSSRSLRQSTIKRTSSARRSSLATDSSPAPTTRRRSMPWAWISWASTS